MHQDSDSWQNEVHPKSAKSEPTWQCHVFESMQTRPLHASEQAGFFTFSFSIFNQYVMVVKRMHTCP